MRALKNILEISIGLFIFILTVAVIAWIIQLIIFSLGIFGLAVVCVVIASCACFFTGDT